MSFTHRQAEKAHTPEAWGDKGRGLKWPPKKRLWAGKVTWARHAWVLSISSQATYEHQRLRQLLLPRAPGLSSAVCLLLYGLGLHYRSQNTKPTRNTKALSASLEVRENQHPTGFLQSREDGRQCTNNLFIYIWDGEWNMTCMVPTKGTVGLSFNSLPR